MNSEEPSEMWEEIPPDKSLAENALKLSKRDLNTALNMLNDDDYDWCFSVSYNSMLQAGRALMFSKGFRPKGEFKHLAVVAFVRKYYRKSFSERVLFMFDKIRKKRHIAVYEQVDIISEDEAKSALDVAKEFYKDIAILL